MIRKVFSTVLVLFGLLTCACAPPISGSSTHEDFSYQDEHKFQELLDATLKRLQESGDDNIHGQITAVNDLHRRYQNRFLQDKSPISVDENIVENNLEKGINLFEGDIMLDEEQYLQLHASEEGKRSNARRPRKAVWPMRIVPYSISPSLNRARSKIKEAVRKLQSASCVRFYEVSGLPRNKNLIYYDKQDGCNSRIGFLHWKKSYQTVSIGNGCDNVGTIIHETLHALGFWHEQSRLDRDRFVKILWGNIQKGQEDQFHRYSEADVDTMNIPYDYESIMHYGRTSFTANGEPTIVRVDNPNGYLGRPQGSYATLSRIDALALNALYDCTNSPIGHRGFSSWTKWTSCSFGDDCSQQRERFCINAPSEYLRKRYCPGANAYGIEKQNRKCARSQCKPIDAGWSYWGKWTDCTVKCGTGTRTRTRRCNDPKPRFGGKPCTGAKEQTGKCIMGKCRLGYYDLQFDRKSLGVWKATTRAFNWELFSSWRRPGPKHDHTTGKGTYAMARTSLYLSHVERTAKLVSPLMSGRVQCITFYYSISGASAKALAVRITLPQRRTPTTWYMAYITGPKDRDWHLGTAQIDAPGEIVKISFDALAHNLKAEGSIAIDDVYFNPGRCQRPKPTAKPTPAPCIDVNKSCKWWAYRGECKKNPKYMLKKCRKSCVCQPVPCVNKNAQCVVWAGKGECTKNKKYMVPQCCKACRAVRLVV